MKILDVGCGPGRHALALARRGITVHGVDLSPEFVELARASAAADTLPATFEVLDVRALEVDGEFDAAICLCQGGFGLLGGEHEEDVIRRIGAAVRPGGPVAVSAFSAAFALRWLEDGEDFDPRTGVLHEHANVRNPEGEERVFDLWTTCFTVRELSLLARSAELEVIGIHGVQPGKYAITPPTLEHPELLLLARRPEAL
jgi:SAM-dependent methyltransferase